MVRLKKIKLLKNKNMKRAKWKGPFVNHDLLRKIKNNKFEILTRNSLVVPKFIGLSLRVYNGKTFVVIKIIKEMVGYKLGEFVPTRKQFFYKKKIK